MMLLTFDLATLTGIAHGVAGTRPEAESALLGRKGASEAEKLAALSDVALHMLREHRPDIVACESAIGGARNDFLLINLVGHLESTAFRLGYRKVHRITRPAVLKHFLTRAVSTADFPGLDPKRSVDKDKASAQLKDWVFRRCLELGWMPGSYDEADAMAVWDLAQVTFCKVQKAPEGGAYSTVHREVEELIAQGARSARLRKAKDERDAA